MFKWVDDSGQTHFGDRIPAKYVITKHEELNQSGDVVKHYRAAETPEQKAERKQLEAEKKKLAQLQKAQRQRDRVLLDTYTTERDLILARDSRLDAVDSQIKLAQSIIDSASKKIDALNARIKRIQSSGRSVPKHILTNLKNEKQQVSMHTQVAAEHRKRRKDIDRQFNDYIKRFRVLKAEQKAQRARLVQVRG